MQAGRDHSFVALLTVETSRVLRSFEDDAGEKAAAGVHAAPCPNQNPIDTLSER
jgi:hypothetical protein